MDRDELLDREGAAWERFVDALAGVPVQARAVEGVVPGWSTHDVFWHCAFYANYAGEMIERIASGDPDPDYLDTPESELVAEGRELTWDEIRERAEHGRRRVRDAFSRIHDPPESAVDWFVDDTADHYSEHADQVRSFSRSIGGDP